MPKAVATQTLKDYAYEPVNLKKTLSAVCNFDHKSHENECPDATEIMAKNSTDIQGATESRVEFHRADIDRERYKTRAGKKVTQYQWDVYDFILRIPRGKVTTYKIISDSIGGSARSVGGALKINPFSPYVPCHRVVASNFFIGGFFGQWARRAPSNKAEPKRKEENEIQKKIALLKQEGVFVDARGYLLDQTSVVWRPNQSPELDSE